jgi:hypothetical protein
MLRDPSIALPGHVAMEEVVEASRRAVQAFLAMDPDKPSLAAWLLGPYHEATSFLPRRNGRLHSAEAAGAHHTTPANIQDLVSMTQTVIVAALDAARRGVDDLVELLPPVVQVRPAHDVYGDHGFVPLDQEHLRLVDRVLALVVADYLTRPEDFLRDRPTSGTHSTGPSIDRDVVGRAS